VALLTTTTSTEMVAPETADGFQVGTDVDDLVGFYGTTPAAQPASGDQAVVSALTDNSGGTASTTLAANLARQHVPLYMNLADITASGDLLTTYTPGYAGKILAVDFAVMQPVTTASKSATLNLEIGSTNVSGGVVTLTSAACTPQGTVVAGTTVSSNNIFTSGSTISIEAASVTAHAEGSGWLMLTLENSSLCNAVASLAAEQNNKRTLLHALRSALVTLGLIKGAA
jgi:hypothetical protein